MRVMVMIKATKTSESNAMPSEKMLTEMGQYNEELMKAGVMLSGDGLKPTSMGKRVVFSGTSERQVIDGPFPLSEKLLAGYWIWQVKDMDEAVAWVKKCPDPMPGDESVIEIRPFFELEDFGEEMTPELREKEEQMRKALE